MRRLNDFSVAMTEVGMWAKVRVSRNGSFIDGILGRVSQAYICFASNSTRFDGSNEFRAHHEWDEIVQDYSYGWVISVRNCRSFNIKDIVNHRGFDTCDDFELIGVWHEDGSIITPAGSTVESTETPMSEMKFIHNQYTTDIIYKGVHGYHHHHGMTQNKPKTEKRGHKIGIELEVEFKNREEKTKWNNEAKSNWFYSERDGSLNDATGVEIITVPMTPKDIKARATWEPLINYLSNKAKSWDSPRCGLHVHIGREILGSNPEQQSETIGKLLYLYHHFVNGTDMNTRIFGRSRAYNEKDGKTSEGAAVATLGSGVLKLKEIKDTLKKGMIEKSSSDRYFDINLLNTHTIEFRKGRGSINASRIIMVVEYCEMLCKYAKSAKWEEISKDKFVEYVVSNLSKESPLYRFFEAGERCDSSF